MLEDIVQEREARGPVASVAELNAFPVKGMRGNRLTSADVGPHGLPGDRLAMLTDPSGNFITQRTLPELATVNATWDGEALVLSAGEHTIRVAFDEAAPRRTVTVWRSTVDALAATDEADAAVSALLGRPVHVVKMDPADPRPVSTEFTGAQEFTAFADGYPILLVNAASLDDLTMRMMEAGGEAVPMARFRPNIVVRGVSAWAEDSWRRVRVGEAVLRLVKPCDRCIVTTTDQDTGAREGNEPLVTLRKVRRSADSRVQGVLFGWNCVIEAPGAISVGNTVTVLEAGEAWPIR